MGAYYNTAEGKFIDFIYKPDTQMQKAIAAQDVALEGLKGKLININEQFTEPKLTIFQEHEGKAQEILQPMGEKLNSLVSQVVKDPENVNVNAQLRTAIKDMSKELKSGDISKMQNLYSTWQAQNKAYEDMISKAKDEDERTGFKNMQNVYNAWVKQQVAKGYDPEFKLPGGAGYVNAQNILKETVDTEGLKYITTRPGMQTGVIYYDPNTGKEGKVDPNTMEVDMERRVVKDKNTGQIYGAAISFDPSIQYLTGTEFQTYEHTLEGYYQNTIHQVALANLLNNDAFISMERQKYRLGDAGGTNEKGEKETEQQYIYRKANEQARIYAAKYAEVTTDKLTAKINTNTERLEAIKLKNAKALKDYEENYNKIPEIIEVTTITTPRYTESEIKKLQDEYASFVGRKNLTPQEKERFQELQNQFGSAYDEAYIDKILITAGIFNDDVLDEPYQQKLDRMMVLFSKIHYAEANQSKTGTFTAPSVSDVMGLTGKSLMSIAADMVNSNTADPDIAKYQNVAEKLRESGIFDSVSQAAKSIVYTENALSLQNPGSKDAKFQSILNQYTNTALSQSSKKVLSGTKHAFDSYGKLRVDDDATRDYQLDANMPDKLLAAIKAQDDKVKDWGTAVEKGYVNIQMITQGNNAVFYIKPLKDIVLSKDENIGVTNTMTVIVPNMDVSDKQSFVRTLEREYGNNSDVMEIVRNTNTDYNSIKRKIQAAEAALNLNPSINYTFKAHRIDNADYQKLISPNDTPKDISYVLNKDDNGFYNLSMIETDTGEILSSEKFNSIDKVKLYLVKRYVY